MFQADDNNYFLVVVGSFSLTVKAGQFTDSEIVVMLGENGTGKTTFIRMLAGKLAPDSGGQLFVKFKTFKMAIMLLCYEKNGTLVLFLMLKPDVLC